ncbi:MAG: dephospho-CoA kinase [Eubacteriales bacterium]
MIIGLTGNSGSGKSTVAGIFADSGFFIIDCDAYSRALDSDPEYVSEIEKQFGRSAVSFSNGHKRVDRRALAELVFGASAEKDAVSRLDSISHPMIIAKINAQISLSKAENRSIVIDAPLLFESGLDRICDATVGVIAPENVRIKRLALRDGIGEDVAKKRFSAQKDEAFLKENCDFIINNGDECKELRMRVLEIIKAISERE